MKNSDYISINNDALEVQPNGFLNVLANITRTGVFVYSRMDPDGTVHTVRQLRLPEEVFSEEALSSLIGLPITNNHPTELISPENASEFIVGMSSDQPKKIFAPMQNGDQEEFVQQLVTFFDKDTIEDVVEGRKNELSLGYSTELEDAPGLWKGQHYDVVQRNIRYNHLSLVAKARGGRNCKVILDDREVTVQLDGESYHEDEVPKEDNINDDDKGEDMKIFKYGGKEFNVEDDVHALLTSITANLDGVNVDVTAKLKEVETLTAKNDELVDQLKIQKDSDDKESFHVAVKARVALEGQAIKVLGDDVCLDGLSDCGVKKKVIAKIRPSANLKDKSNDYIDARFEVCLEDAAESSEENEDENKIGKNVKNEDASDEDIVSIARKKAWVASKELYKAKA